MCPSPKKTASFASPHITMDDVAARCGITKSTVSRALNKPEKVNPATRKRVEEAVKELGYLYNPWASSPGKPRREFLGVMVSQLREMTYNETLTVIDEMAASARYEVLFAVTHENTQRESEVMLRFRQYRASAIICLGATLGMEPLLKQARAEGTPNLMLWETSGQPEVNFIGVDNKALAAKATSELLRLGHTRIALFLGGSPHLKRGMERVEGYQETLRLAGHTADTRFVHFLEPMAQASGQSSVLTCHTVTQKLLSLPERPTAFLTPNGQLSMAVMAAVEKAGLRVPEDISLLCLGDDALAACVQPGISAMEAGGPEMHLLLSLFLQQVFRGEINADLRHTLSPSFVPRGSTGPCPI